MLDKIKHVNVVFFKPNNVYNNMSYSIQLSTIQANSKAIQANTNK